MGPLWRRLVKFEWPTCTSPQIHLQLVDRPCLCGHLFRLEIIWLTIMLHNEMEEFAWKRIIYMFLWIFCFLFKMITEDSSGSLQTPGEWDDTEIEALNMYSRWPSCYPAVVCNISMAAAKVIFVFSNPVIYIPSWWKGQFVCRVFRTLLKGSDIAVAGIKSIMTNMVFRWAETWKLNIPYWVNCISISNI